MICIEHDQSVVLNSILHRCLSGLREQNRSYLTLHLHFTAFK